MKIASNKVIDLIRFYKEQLSGMYEPGELQSVIDLAFEHYLGFSRNDLQTRQQEPVNQSDLIKIYDACKALATGQPLQYVLGEAWFYGLRFRVNPSVLIPRPETEELVDIVLKDLKPVSEALCVIDMGTGSGCIPVTLKKHRPQDDVYGLDVSPAALETAAANAALNHADLTWINQDLLRLGDTTLLNGAPYHVIISNPPYINVSEAAEMTTQVKDHEPHLALFVEGSDDTVFYKRIIDLCRKNLLSGGKLYFELNPLTASLVLAYAETSGLFKTVELMKDMSGKMRFLKAVRNT